MGPLKIIDWAYHDAKTWNIGAEIRQVFFKFLNKVTPFDPHCPRAKDSSGLLLPQCMCDWALGQIKGKDLLQKLEKIIDAHPEYFASKRESTLIKTLCRITFNPEKLAVLRKPVIEMWQFIRNCKEQGYHIYILSNRDEETIQEMTKQFPYLEELTDGILTSSEAKTLKPDPAIFYQLFEKFNIKPKYSIFFDDRIENINAAKSVGMSTIWCYKGKTFRKILEDFNTWPIHLQIT